MKGLGKEIGLASGRVTWRNGGWLQEAWGNRAGRVAPGEDPRKALRRCVMLSHLPIEVEDALRAAGDARPAVYPRVRPVEPRAALRRSSPRLTPPRGATAPVSSPVSRGAVHEPQPPQPFARLAHGPSFFEGGSLPLPAVAALLALVPPMGVFFLWLLPSYPRDGKIAATIASFLWFVAMVFVLA